MESEKSVVMLSDFQDNFNYLNLFPSNMLISELLSAMGITRLTFKFTVKH